MFRLQEHMPDVYVNESRDFQVLCRLYDFLFNGIKFDIDSIININDAFRINERLLPLLAIKEGFFTDVQFDSKTLRYILKAFPYIIKYKGTKKGLELAVNTILKLEASSDVPQITIDENKTITVITQIKQIEHRTALEELLKYVLPIGSDVVYIFDKKEVEKSMQCSTSSKVQTMLNYTSLLGAVYDSNFIKDTGSNTEKYMKGKYVFSSNSTEVVSENMITAYKDKNKNIQTTSGTTYYKESHDE